MTRKEAKEIRENAIKNGLKTYFTGRPCKHGHICKRRCDNATCVKCASILCNRPEYIQEGYHKEYYKNNKNRIKKRIMNYYVENKEKILKYAKTYKKENKNKVRTYQKEKRNNDINYRLAGNLRGRLYQAIRYNFKSGSAVHDLGCSIKTFKIYLACQFTQEMNWDNYGSYWHIDHIEPLSKFDLTDREQFLEAVHFTNLQPMEGLENLSKGKKSIVQH